MRRTADRAAMQDTAQLGEEGFAGALLRGVEDDELVRRRGGRVVARGVQDGPVGPHHGRVGYPSQPPQLGPQRRVGQVDNPAGCLSREQRRLGVEVFALTHLKQRKQASM